MTHNTIDIFYFYDKKIAFTQRGVWRQAGCCLVGHFAGIWEFATRPSLTDAPACGKLIKRYMPPVQRTKTTN